MAAPPRRRSLSAAFSPTRAASVPSTDSRNRRLPSGRATTASRWIWPSFHLAAPAQLFQQDTLRVGLDPGAWILEKRYCLPYPLISGTGFEAERSLSSGRAHGLDWNQLSNRIGSSQPSQACRGKNYGVILPRLELSQSRIHIPAQRIHHHTWTDRLQLRFSA